MMRFEMSQIFFIKSYDLYEDINEECQFENTRIF